MYVHDLSVDLRTDQVTSAARVFHGMETLFRRRQGFMRADMMMLRGTSLASFKTFWSSDQSRRAFESEALEAIMNQLSPYFANTPSPSEYDVLVEIDVRITRSNY